MLPVFIAYFDYITRIPHDVSFSFLFKLDPFHQIPSSSVLPWTYYTLIFYSFILDELIYFSSIPLISSSQLLLTFSTLHPSFSTHPLPSIFLPFPINHSVLFSYLKSSSFMTLFLAISL